MNRFPAERAIGEVDGEVVRRPRAVEVVDDLRQALGGIVSPRPAASTDCSLNPIGRGGCQAITVLVHPERFKTFEFERK